MKLYHHPASANARRVLATALQLDLDRSHGLETVLVDLMTGEHKSPAFLALNPNGRVPVLVDGDFILWESVAIMQYLGSLKPSSLWPEDARVRADISRWQSWDLAHFGRAADIFLFENLVKGLFGLGAPDEHALAAAGEAFRQHATVLERHLDGRPWLVGEQPTLADLSLAAPVSNAPHTGLPLEGFPGILAWFERVSQLPGWRRATGG